VQAEAASALVSKGATLRALGRREDAIAAYDEVEARFADSRQPALVEVVVTAREMRDSTRAGQ
jgi:hypothetical protein